MSALEECWVIELHPKGGSRLSQARDVMRENLAIYARGERPEWVPVALREDLAAARAKLAEVRKALRDGDEGRKR